MQILKNILPDNVNSSYVYNIKDTDWMGSCNECLFILALVYIVANGPTGN